MNKVFKQLLFPLICLLTIFNVMANVAPNSLFSDHMVLQQNTKVPIWGTASEGEIVTVNFNNQKVSTKTVNGKWKLYLKSLQAGGPFKLIITGENVVTVDDVLVGEVWLCSGQSNMEEKLKARPKMKPIYNKEQEIAEANYPKIRLYHVSLGYSPEPLDDKHDSWRVCSPETVDDFSAVAYFFAKNLYNNLKTPVGILLSAFGGTDAENWINTKDLNASPEFKNVVSDYQKAIANSTEKFKEYKLNENAILKQYSVDSLKAISENKPIPARQSPPAAPFVFGYPGGLYNSMIHPLLPYAIKGVCWYQGENNKERYRQYASLLSLLINGWRKDFQVGDFPFLIVQVAPFKTMNPEIREAQWEATKIVKNTALIVTTDCGDSLDIHPPYKQPVGERLAMAARALAYNQKIEYSGPQYKNMSIKGNQISLSFDHARDGFSFKGTELYGFTIAGADNHFIKANAMIEQNKIIVSANEIKKPVAVRYGWDDVPVVNLYNKQDLPAVPFRTDK